MLALFLAALDAARIVDEGLAPFVAVGTITATVTAAMAFAAKAEVISRGLDRATADAYVQGAINDGLAWAGALSFWPVAVLLGDAVT